MSTVTYISKEEHDLLHEDLVPQFLGLWLKMYQDGIPAHVGKRSMAFALFKTCSHLRETKNIGNSKEFVNLCSELGAVVDKYCDKGLHFAQISASLELQITNILGTRCEEKKDD